MSREVLREEDTLFLALRWGDHLAGKIGGL